MHEDTALRIARLYRRDRNFSLLLVGLLAATLGWVCWSLDALLTPAVRHLLAAAGIALVAFNAAAVLAMLRHNHADRSFVYALDIRHLDEYRLLRAARRRP